MTSMFLNMALSYYNDLEKGNNMLKERAINEYHLALKMPRKKKKKAKKAALQLYSIACWTDNLLTI